MIILDTNVISEPLRAAPDGNVVRWLDAQAVETLWLTSIGLAEIRYGIAALPRGHRRNTLHSRFEDEVLPVFGERVLGFNADATVEYARIRASARAAGRPPGDFDALIAAIVKTHGGAVATRDVAPFAAAGLRVIDPFNAGYAE